MTTDGSSGSLNIPGGDINGDGQSDILWRHATAGQTAVWYMEGSTLASGALIEPTITVPQPWTLSGVGDFNQDGVSDLLWHQPEAGQLAVWYLDSAGALVTGEVFPDTIPSAWKVSGVGDFNGDQKSDILWRHSTSGEIVAWYMDGITLTGGELLGAIPIEWQVKGISDFNADGNDDLVWYHQVTGDIVLWYMDGVAFNDNAILGFDLVRSFPNTLWELRGTGDFNTDGHTDLLWWHNQTGDLVAWYMKGATFDGGNLLETLPDTDWSPIGQARGGLPDLTVSGVVVPPSVIDGDTVNTTISVVNQGSKTSAASTLKYYLSADDALDPNDDLFLGELSTKVLLAGESVDLVGSFVYDVNTMGAPGAKYLFFVADANGVVGEGSNGGENNNTFSQVLNVVTPTPLDVDLVPENVVIPPIWTVGNELTISVDVKNQGTDNVASSNLFVYLLDSATFDPSAIPILTTTVEALGPSISTTKSFTFTYLEEYGTGPKYLYFVTDADGLIAETNETNNIVSNAITVGSADNSIDFTISGITIPSSVVLEQSILGSITLLNQGETPSPATTLSIYVSNYTDPSDTLDLDTADLLASLTVNPLAGGEARAIPLDIVYGRLLGSGQKNIFFVVDAEDAVVELNELNNVEKRLIDATPPEDVDLVISAASVSPTAIIPGDSFNISATVQNVGTVATGTSTLLRIYLSDDEIIDSNDTILYGITINNLAGGASQVINRNYTYLSSDPPGVKYILFDADANNNVFEQEETNNLAVRPLTVNEIKPGIDLVISSASVSTTTLISGDPITVTASVQNQGENSAPNNKLGIYVSTDAIYDAGDLLIAEFDTGSIPTYDTFNQSHTFNYLDEYGLEAQYILVVADHPNQVAESDEGNNVQAFAITVAPDLNRPDLVMDSIPTDDPATFITDLSAGIQFDYVVKNQGLRTTTQPFNIKFYLADQNYTTLADVEANALTLGSLADLNNLVPIESEENWGGTGQYSTTVSFLTDQFDSNDPLWSAGLRYLIAVVDYGNGIRESDENNNIYSVSFNLS